MSSKNPLFNRLPPNLTVQEVITNMESKKKGSAGKGGTISLATAKRRAAITDQVKRSLAVASPANAAADMRPGVEFGGFTELKCTDIIPYDNNPRHGSNPKYEEIKASIRERGGLSDTLSVTKRPGSDQYMLYMGGNTRLKILQDLYRETHDPRFLIVKCTVFPWKSEADTLSAHLVENEARADTTFYEKSRGVAMLKRELERERNSQLSLNQLADETGRLGMPRSAATLIEYLFATDYMDRAADWLTKEITNRVRMHHQSLETIAKIANIATPVFGESMRKVFNGIGNLDGSGTDNIDSTAAVAMGERANVIRARMTQAMADLLDVPVTSMQHVVEAAGQGRADDSRIRAMLETARSGAIEDVPPTPDKGMSSATSTVGHTAPDDGVATEQKSAPITRKSPRAGQSAKPAKETPPAASSTTPKETNAAPMSFIEEAHDDDTLLVHLDDPVALFEAQLGRFCDRFSLNDLLRIDPHLPYHFWMEWPEKNIPLEALDTDSAPGAHRALAYLVLISLSGQLDSDVVALLPTDSRWSERFTSGSFDHEDGPFDMQYQHVLSGVVGDNGGAFGMSWRAMHALMSTPVLWGWVDMLTQAYHGLVAALDATSADAGQR